MTINSLSLQTCGSYPLAISQIPQEPKCFTQDEAKEYVLKHKIPVFMKYLEYLNESEICLCWPLDYCFPSGLEEIVSNYVNGNNSINEALIKYCSRNLPKAWGLLEDFLSREGCIIDEETVVPMIISNNPSEYILKKLLEKIVSPHILRDIPQVISLSFGVDTLKTLIGKEAIDFSNKPDAWTYLKKEECALYILEQYPDTAPYRINLNLVRTYINLAVEKQWPNVLRFLLELYYTKLNNLLSLRLEKQSFSVLKNDFIDTINHLIEIADLFNEHILYWIIIFSAKLDGPLLIEKVLDRGIILDASSLKQCVDLNFYAGANIILSRNPKIKPSFIELGPLILKKNCSIDSWANVFFQNGIPISNEMIYEFAQQCMNLDWLYQVLRDFPDADRSIIFIKLCSNHYFDHSYFNILEELLKDGATLDQLTKLAIDNHHILNVLNYNILRFCFEKNWSYPEFLTSKVILIYFTFAKERNYDELARKITDFLFKTDNVGLVKCTKKICSQLRYIKIHSYQEFVDFIGEYEKQIKDQILDTYNNHKRWGLTPQSYWCRIYARGQFKDRYQTKKDHKKYFYQLDDSPIPKKSSYGLNVELYNELLPIMKAVLENNNNYYSKLHSYKLAVLFTSKEEVESYLENYRLKHPLSVQPVHDACLFELPSQGIWSVSTWRRILKRENYHGKWMKLLPLASIIENYLFKYLTPYPTLHSQGLTRDEIHKKYFQEIKASEKNSQKSVFELFSTEYNEFKKWKEKQKEGKRKNVKNATTDSVREGSDHIESVPATSTVRKDSRKIERGNFIKFIIKNSGQRDYYREIIALEKTSQKSVFELFEKEYEKFTKWKEIKKKGKRKNVQDRTADSVRACSDYIASVSATSTLNTDSKNFERGDFIHFIIKNSDFSCLTYDQIVALCVRIHYGDVPDEHKLFAFECVRCGVTRADFDRVLTTTKHRSSETNFVPDVLVRGEDLGFPEFRLEKMKDTDPMIALAGYKTGCCQSINGGGRDAALHALESPYGGIYRIMKEDVWVAQAWTALTANNELLFDSIEWNLIFKEKEEMVLAFFDAAARAVLRDNPMIKRVLCGTGGSTPQQHSYPYQDPGAISKIIGYESFGYDSEKRFIMADRQQLAHSSTSSTSPTLQYIESKGIDTFLNPRSTVYQPAQHPFARSHFRDTHPRAMEIIKHKKSPLVEEGFCKSYSFADRDRYGEHFIPLEGIKRIINGKIAEKNYRVTYRSFIANDLIQLIDFLSSFSLSEGENAMMVYVDGVHAIPIYFESIDSQRYAVMIDSEGIPKGEMNEVAEAIVRRFPDIKLIQNIEKIQLDFYSCSTCAIKVILYFAKHGLKLLQSIQFEDNSNRYDLDFTTLPIELLKFHQKPEKLLTLFDRVVKPRTSETLGDYFERNALRGKTRIYNLALIKKRDRYLDDLERICLMNDGVRH